MIVLGVAGPNLGALGIKGNSEVTARLGLLGGTSVIYDGLMILIATMREVHSHDVHPSLAELIDGLDRVRLGPDSADDGGSTICLGRSEGGIQVGEPFDSAPHGEVIEGVDHDDGVTMQF